jgi:molybdopterin/thiamine biosynthesis adenylyltransferase
MNADALRAHLCKLGFDAQGEEKIIQVSATIETWRIEIRHEIPDELTRTPIFHLVNAADYGPLAHVELNQQTQLGEICTSDSDTTAINYEVPELVYADQVEACLALIHRGLTDPAWNRAELIREFHAHWGVLCTAVDPPLLELVCVSDQVPCRLTVKKPKPVTPSQKKSQATNKKLNELTLAHVAMSESGERLSSLQGLRDAFSWSGRSTAGRGIVLRLDDLHPAPFQPDDLSDWYVQAIDQLNDASRAALAAFSKREAREFWIVFVGPCDGGETWCALRLRHRTRRALPTNEAMLDGWTLLPVIVRALSPTLALPRGGASTQLLNKRVLLVGCGSVGAPLAHQLANGGIGHITLSDPQPFTLENIFRHTLPLNRVGINKADGLAEQIASRCPWIDVVPSQQKLDDFRDREVLERYDLVVIAVGDPNAERRFHDFLVAQGVNVPVTHTWLEALGVGGHAILEIPGQRGCLRCAYVDVDTLSRGLTPNLNFIVPGQVIARAQGGCGTQFLPYNGVAASQTASIAAGLSLQFLESQLSESAKVSWKGPNDAAEREGIEMTYRFRQFNQSLEILALYNTECDVCD